MTAPGRIVVGSDASTASRAALAWGVDEARRRGWTVHILEALDFTALDTATEALTERSREDALAAREEAMDQLAAELAGAGVEVTTEVALGGAGPSLAASVTPADLLVVGATGRGMLKRAVLGSVSQWVSLHAVCPVVIVPDDEQITHRRG